MEKEKLIKEVKRDLQKRIEVWKPVGGVFRTFEHQQQYETLQFVLTVLEHVSPNDYQKLLAKINGKQVVQGSMF